MWARIFNKKSIKFENNRIKMCATARKFENFNDL